MYSNTSPQSLVHLPRNPSRQQPQRPEPNLPRGECRFILAASEPDGSKSRCSCVSFTLDNGRVGTLCGCGHQAWHHISHQPGEWVSIEEYMATVERVKRLEEVNRQLQDELLKERADRKKVDQSMWDALQGNYQNLAKTKIYLETKMEKQMDQMVEQKLLEALGTLKVNFDDRLEAILDKTIECANSVKGLEARVEMVDEASIRLEERVDSGKWNSRSLTPLQEATRPLSTPKLLSLRIEDSLSKEWDVRIIFVMSRLQHFAHAYNSVAWRRCQSRSMHQDLHLTDRESKTFITAVETAFVDILQKRAWMPLYCLSSADMQLKETPLEQRSHYLWDYTFLEKNCLAHDKAQGDIIYISLQAEELSWADINKLPVARGSDESCWQHDPDLDVGTSTNHNANTKDGKPADVKMMDYKMDMVKSLESDSLYEYSPPPYTSRTHLDMDHRLQAASTPSGLDVLATQASLLPRHTAQSLSDRSSLSITAATTFSGRSTFSSDDEHKDKRVRTGTSLPHLPLPGSPPPVPSPMYYSGRTKRRITTSSATKEPFGPIAPSEMKLPSITGKRLFHRHGDGKDKPGTMQS